MVYFSCQLGFLLYHLATTEKKGTKKESMMEGEWGLIEVFTICFWGSMCIEYMHLNPPRVWKFVPLKHQNQTWRLKFDTLVEGLGIEFIYLIYFDILYADTSF